jgi:hypothetical protein
MEVKYNKMRSKHERYTGWQAPLIQLMMGGLILGIGAEEVVGSHMHRELRRSSEEILDIELFK